MSRTSWAVRASASVAILAAAGLGVGCAPPVVARPAGACAHSPCERKAPDMIWVQQPHGREFVLMRCYEEAERSRCTRVMSFGAYVPFTTSAIAAPDW